MTLPGSLSRVGWESLLPRPIVLSLGPTQRCQPDQEESWAMEAPCLQEVEDVTALLTGPE